MGSERRSERRIATTRGKALSAPTSKPRQGLAPALETSALDPRRLPPAPNGPPGDFTTLQRTVGNRAIGQLIQALAAPSVAGAQPSAAGRAPVRRLRLAPALRATEGVVPIQRVAVQVRSGSLHRLVYEMDNSVYYVPKPPSEPLPTFGKALDLTVPNTSRRGVAAFAAVPPLNMPLALGDNVLDVQDAKKSLGNPDLAGPDLTDYEADVVRIRLVVRDGVELKVDAPTFKALDALNQERHEVALGPGQVITLYDALLGTRPSQKVKKALEKFAQEAALQAPVQVGRNMVAFLGPKGAVVTYLDAVAKPAPVVRGDLSSVAQLGTEFTFTDDAMIAAAKKSRDEGAISTEYSREKRDAWVAAMRGVPDLVIEEKPSTRYENEKIVRFVFPDGWWYSLSLDPGVIETQTKPMTLTEARGPIGQRIRELVFGTAKQLGLRADASFGGGHIHLDVATTFGSNEQLFADFVADYENQAVAMEAFEHDPTNAPRLAYFQPKERKGDDKRPQRELARELDERDARMRFAKCLDSFRMRKEKQGLDAMRTLAKDIQRDVYRNDDVKYSALNFQHLLRIEGFNTVEIRAIRAQRSYDEFLLEADLFLKRIAYLEKQGVEKNINPAFNPKISVTSDPNQLEAEGKVIDALTTYLTEIGLDPAPYVELARAYRNELYAAIERDRQ